MNFHDITKPWSLGDKIIVALILLLPPAYVLLVMNIAMWMER